MNVTVSDGQFSETVGVSVQVEQATAEMLQDALTLRFHDLSPQDFVETSLHDVKKTLQGMLGTKPEALHVIGVQPVAQSSLLEVLLVAEAQKGRYVESRELALRLAGLQEALTGKVRLKDVLDQSCSGELDCGEEECRVSLKVEPGAGVSYRTSTMSLVLPRYRRTQSCTCAGTFTRVRDRAPANEMEHLQQE